MKILFDFFCSDIFAYEFLELTSKSTLIPASTLVIVRETNDF